MKGKGSKKEKKTEKVEGATSKAQSDYQNEKTRKSTLDITTTKTKK